jgi:Xaa-Pro aminopeptidase
MMFPAEVYRQRRYRLRELVGKGVILFLGNKEVAMNYPNNSYPFRQDSSFLYYFGLDLPGLAGMIDCEQEREVLYGVDPTLEDAIWVGQQPSLQERALQVGVTHVKPLERLDGDVFRVIAHNREVHYLPPYREQRRLQLAYYDNLKYEEVDRNASSVLIRAVVSQRSIKDKHEVQEIENTLSQVTSEAFAKALAFSRPGVMEYQVAGMLKGLVLEKNCRMAFPVICSVQGQILHNQHCHNKLKKGQLLLVDAGAESERHYATDITRTYPVGGTFTAQQKEIYQIVLEAQKEAIKSIGPGIPYLEVHNLAACRLVNGLKALGLMKGDTVDAVRHGAHALFFPHGIGHMMGLDVHDMEDIGEDNVGYDEEFRRSEQFGTAYLRLAKRLQEGNVLTVEPGIYFIDALIDKWHTEGRYRDFIDYRMVNKYRGFGGIRIEDDVLVTRKGCRLLGKDIPKAVEELEVK